MEAVRPKPTTKRKKKKKTTPAEPVPAEATPSNIPAEEEVAEASPATTSTKPEEVVTEEGDKKESEEAGEGSITDNVVSNDTQEVREQGEEDTRVPEDAVEHSTVAETTLPNEGKEEVEASDEVVETEETVVSEEGVAEDATTEDKPADTAAPVINGQETSGSAPALERGSETKPVVETEETAPEAETVPVEPHVVTEADGAVVDGVSAPVDISKPLELPGSPMPVESVYNLSRLRSDFEGLDESLADAVTPAEASEAHTGVVTADAPPASPGLLATVDGNDAAEGQGDVTVDPVLAATMSDTLPPSPMQSVEHPIGTQPTSNGNLTLTDNLEVATPEQNIVIPTLEELAPLQITLSQAPPASLAHTGSSYAVAHVNPDLYLKRIEGGGGDDDGDRGSEFYTLLMQFRHALLSLASTQQSVQSLHGRCDTVYSGLWRSETIELKGEAVCGDGVRVQGGMRFERVNFDEAAQTTLGDALTELRDEEFNAHTLATYRVTLAEFEINSVLDLFVSNSTLYSGDIDTRPHHARGEQDHPDRVQLTKYLRILFDLSREAADRLRAADAGVNPREKDVDTLFVTRLHDWIMMLAPLMLAAGTHEDSIFLLTQMCTTSDVSTWGVSLLQFPGIKAGEPIDAKTLQHFLRMLSVLLCQPVLKPGADLNPPDTPARVPAGSELDDEWLVVEDSESPPPSPFILTEDDFIAMLEQFPSEAVLDMVLPLGHGEDASSNLPVSRTTEIMDFANTIMTIFEQCLPVFSAYPHFRKRIARLMAVCSRYVCQSLDGLADTDEEAGYARDAFVTRVANSILRVKEAGIMPFLDQMPIEHVSLSCAWDIFMSFYGYSEEDEHPPMDPSDALYRDTPAEAATTSSLKSKQEPFETLEAFSHHTAHWAAFLRRQILKRETFAVRLERSESLYLLSVLVRIGRAHNLEFASVIAHEMFWLGYVCERSRGDYHKHIRGLLADLCDRHVDVHALLLRLTIAFIPFLGRAACTLFETLPLSTWSPDQETFTQIWSWLKGDPSQHIFRLSQCLLDNLNWGADPESPAALEAPPVATQPAPSYPRSLPLFLPAVLHVDCALALVDVYWTHREIWNSDQGGDIMSWCWERLLDLRTHNPLGQPLTSVLEWEADPRLQTIREILSKPEHSRDSFASCVALLITNVGLVPQLRESTGWVLYQAVAGEKDVGAIMAVTDILSPTLAQQHAALPESDRHSETPMTKVVEAVFNMDSVRRGLSTTDAVGPATRALASLIVSQLCSRSAIEEMGSADDIDIGVGAWVGTNAIVTYWFEVLRHLPNWHRHEGCLYIADLVCSASMAMDARPATQVFLQYAHQQLLQHGKSESSVFSFLFGGASAPSLLPPTATASAGSSPASEASQSVPPWFAFETLFAETHLEAKDRVALSRRAYEKPRSKLSDHCKSLKIRKVDDYVIFKWARYATQMDAEHPLTPHYWQMFFALYFERPFIEPGAEIVNASTGLPAYFFASRFFERKRHRLIPVLISRLEQLAQHHFGRVGQLASSLPARARARSGSAVHDVSSVRYSIDASEIQSTISAHRISSELAQLYAAMGHWLKEDNPGYLCSRIDELSVNYSPQRLSSLLRPGVCSDSNSVMWYDLLNLSQVSVALSDVWKQYESDRPDGPVNAAAMRAIAKQKALARTASSTHLSGSCSTSRPPLPDLVAFPTIRVREPQVLLPAVSALLESRAALTEALVHSDLDVVLRAGKQHSVHRQRCNDLDTEYLSLLPHLYTNEAVVTREQRKCPGRDGNACTNPAVFLFNHTRKRLTESVLKSIQENRNSSHTYGHHLPVTEPVCSSVIRITSLTKIVQSAISSENESAIASLEALATLTSKWFYNFVELRFSDASQYPPVASCIADCVPIIGNKILASSAIETRKLLDYMIEHPERVDFLAPYFQPHSFPRTFAENLGIIVNALSSLKDSVESTLKALNFAVWLSEGDTTVQERSLVLTSLGKAMTTSAVTHGALTLLHDAFIKVSEYNFPFHYNDALRIITDGCLAPTQPDRCRVDPALLWSFSFLPIKESLPALQKIETIQYLTMYFTQLRAKCTSLYQEWGDYVEPALALLADLVLAPDARSYSGDTPPMFQLLCDVVKPWLESTASAPAWPQEAQAEGPSAIVESFTKMATSLSATKIEIPSLIWAYYQQVLLPHAPVYLLRVLHTGLLGFQWSLWKPTREEVAQLSKLACRRDRVTAALPPEADFIASIFMQIRWPEHIKALIDSNALTDDEWSSFYFDILSVILSVLYYHSSPIDPGFLAFVANTFPELPTSRLSAQSFRALIARFPTLQPVKLDDPSVAFPRTLSALAEVESPHSRNWAIALLLQSLTGDPVTQFSAAKVDTAAGFLLHPLSLLTPESQLCLSGAQYAYLFSQSLQEIAVVSGHTIADSLDDVQRTVLSSLNCIHEAVSPPIQTAFNDIVKSQPQLAPALLRSLCESVMSVELLADCAEATIEAHIASGTTSWQDLVTSLVVPEIDEEEFYTACCNRSAIYTLYTVALQGATEPIDVQVEGLGGWLPQINLQPDRETRVLLLWHRFLNAIVSVLLPYSAAKQETAKDLMQFADYCLKLAEDKNSSGLLGAIGFGGKSPYSPEFRLASRILGTFVKCRLDQGSLAPYLDTTQPLRIPQEGGRAITSLRGLPNSNRAYKDYQSVVDTAIQMVGDPQLTVLDYARVMDFVVASLLSPPRGELRCDWFKM